MKTILQQLLRGITGETQSGEWCTIYSGQLMLLEKRGGIIADMHAYFTLREEDRGGFMADMHAYFTLREEDRGGITADMHAYFTLREEDRGGFIADMHASLHTLLLERRIEGKS